jgi:hypothetical protein
LESKIILKCLGAIQPKGLNRIAKIKLVRSLLFSKIMQSYKRAEGLFAPLARCIWTPGSTPSVKTTKSKTSEYFSYKGKVKLRNPIH